jgi:hypothetical protein
MFITNMSDRPGQGFGSLTYDSSPTIPSTAAPETFTIVGTLIGGAAAFRMRRKYKATNKM